MMSGGNESRRKARAVAKSTTEASFRLERECGMSDGPCGCDWRACPDCYPDEDPGPPPLEDDRTAMMLGLVPDKRTPIERLLDAIRTKGGSLKYHYEPDEHQDGCLCAKCRGDRWNQGEIV